MIDFIPSLVAGAVVLVYDTLLNLGEEIDLVWKPLCGADVPFAGCSHVGAKGPRKAPRVLEIIMRYAMIVTACMNIACT